MLKDFVDKIADRTRWGYLAAFSILLISYIVSFVSTQRLMSQLKWVNHSNEVIHSLDNVVGLVTQGESAARGYMITDRKPLLLQFYQSRAAADSAVANVKEFTADNKLQQKNIDSLRVLVNDKFSWLERAIAIFNVTHTITESLLNGKNEGVEKMTRVKSFTEQVQREEKALWQTRNSRLERYSVRIKSFTVISLIVAILLTLYSVFTFNKENKAKREAREKADAYRKQLELRVDELAALNLELIELRNIEKFAATGRISRTIAHEIRNPLTNINLATEQLRNEVSISDDVTLFFDMIARNSNRINQLISDLLNSTRVSELKFIKTSINDVLDKSLEFAADRIELKRIKVVKKYDPDICHVKVDEEKIIIALLNIIVNAIEAMNPEGVLFLSTESRNNRCLTIIRDNGRGMPKEDISRLFEPYFTTKERGTGLGLTNTQNIVLAHDANIHVESEPGKGTTFTLSFNFA